MLETNFRILNVTKYVCATIITLGTILFIYGYASGFSNVVGIGYGTVMGGVFIFIMGLFLAATGEMLERKKNG
ncbi:hypothetical protein [Oceanobacillus salinisoli]|uniref:hypothetical protein n=1 Tax=Oceanobacillus salinisoli TaxID=2678611 RepID=UPI0012E19626|nr:hypothetical protein [Oceanobacillus salinisoli]